MTASSSLVFKRFFLLPALLFHLSLSIQAQGCPPTDIQASFMAIIVHDIDLSIKWYSEKLGFELVNRADLEDRGISQANLKQTDTHLELIQTKDAVSIQTLLDGQQKGTKVEGLFKFGITIPHFDEWMKHLEEVKTEFHGDVVRDPVTSKRMIIIKDPDGNRIQLFEE